MTTYVAYKGPIKIYKEVVPRKKQKEKKKPQVTLIPLALLTVTLPFSGK